MGRGPFDGTVLRLRFASIVTWVSKMDRPSTPILVEWKTPGRTGPHPKSGRPFPLPPSFAIGPGASPIARTVPSSAAIPNRRLHITSSALRARPPPAHAATASRMRTSRHSKKRALGR
jgi:hypothetical protein